MTHRKRPLAGTTIPPSLSAVATLLLVAPAVAEPLKKPPPTSLAWQLRPAAATSVVRSDTSIAGYDDAAGGGTTVVSNLVASYKVTPSLAPLVRVALVRNDPDMAESATAVSNPLLGLTWARPLAPAIKLAVFGGVALP